MSTWNKINNFTLWERFRKHARPASVCDGHALDRGTSAAARRIKNSWFRMSPAENVNHRQWHSI